MNETETPALSRLACVKGVGGITRKGLPSTMLEPRRGSRGLRVGPLQRPLLGRRRRPVVFARAASAARCFLFAGAAR